MATPVPPAVPPETVLARFDALPPLDAEEMLGRWRGAEVPTGHPFDGLLSAFGWHGKRFDSVDDGHPLVFDTGGLHGRLFTVNPALVPMETALRFPTVVRARPVAAAGRAYLRASATSKPRSRVRMAEYRGVVSATMIYDALPVNDHFRRVDDDTLLGAMDHRSTTNPYFFTLHRE